MTPILHRKACAVSGSSNIVSLGLLRFRSSNRSFHKFGQSLNRWSTIEYHRQYYSIPPEPVPPSGNLGIHQSQLIMSTASSSRSSDCVLPVSIRHNSRFQCFSLRDIQLLCKHCDLYIHLMRVMAEEEEIGLPRAGLNKLIKDTLPNIRVANESRDVVYNCCLDFIKVIAAEANNLCNQEQRKTISHEHVLKAIENLGFGPEYVTASASVLDNCREQAAKRLKRQGSRLERLGIPEEELLRQQQELIEKARHEQAAEEQTQMALFHQMMAEHNESLLVSESGTSNSSAATAVEGSSNSTSNGVQQQPQLQQLFDLSLLNGQSNSKLSKLSDELDEDYDID